MGRITFRAINIVMVLALAALSGAVIFGNDITLPAPQTDGGQPLMKALKERKTQRSFSDKMIPVQTLSNLLWAANGINRPDTDKHTAPTSMNCQEIQIYAAMKDGLYLYNPKKHSLELVMAKDIRPLTGMQPFVAEAPLNLIYVADFSKMMKTSAEDKALYSAVDTGFISQNVYLFCASEGLATVVRGYVDRKVLAKAMKLSSHQKIILSQTVGFPK